MIVTVTPSDEARDMLTSGGHSGATVERGSREVRAQTRLTPKPFLCDCAGRLCEPAREFQDSIMSGDGPEFPFVVARVRRALHQSEQTLEFSSGDFGRMRAGII